MLKAEKQRLRAGLLERRAAIPARKKQQMEQQITQTLLSLQDIRSAEMVLCYWSTPKELQTHDMVKGLWEMGKTVALPRCTTQPGIMEFYAVTDPEQLVKSKFGILEPDPALCRKVADFGGSVCILPALAVDKKGFRLGYGGGYYDRFLQNYPGKTIAVTFSQFVVEALPTGKFDIAAHAILTECGLVPLKKHQ